MHCLRAQFVFVGAGVSGFARLARFHAAGRQAYSRASVFAARQNCMASCSGSFTGSLMPSATESGVLLASS